MGHNNISETFISSGFYSSSTCGTTTVRVNPPTGVPLKSITIKYRPAYGSSSTGYYNLSGPLRPEPQYISIGNIVLTAIGGCTPLPVELISFNGNCQKRIKDFKWSTASEQNNDYFTLEHSRNGTDFYPVKTLPGAGNSSTIQNYSVSFSEIEEDYLYYRLKQTDTDGVYTYSDVIYVSCNDEDSDQLSIFPNPSNDFIVVNFGSSVIEDSYVLTFTDMVGKVVHERDVLVAKNSKTVVDVSAFSNGYYFLHLTDKNTGKPVDIVRFSKVN